MTSNITIESVNNIVIKSQINATIRCANPVKLCFVSCSNVIIEGITWQECGGLQFHSSSNTTIQDCCFHNSTRQAVVMSEVSGDAYIKNCQFLSNVYSGHGSAIQYSYRAAIQYSYWAGTNPSPEFSINNCSFTSNGPSTSVVYIASSSSSFYPVLLLQDSVLANNNGVPIYLSNVHGKVLGTVLIKHNTARSGGGIFSFSSSIEFNNCRVHFNNNSVRGIGGAVYLSNSELAFGLNTSVRFENNTARVIAGGIYSYGESSITFFNNSVVNFRNNIAGTRGGAVYARHYSYILITDTSSVKFDGNSARVAGGAIAAYGYLNIKFDGNSSVRFSNNVVRSKGGAIFITECSMLFEGNSAVDFHSNNASYGPAIYSHSDVFIDKNSVVTFLNNGDGFYGGAIFLNEGHLFAYGDSTVTFYNNTGTYGGAIYATQYSDISFGGNTVVNFTSNIAAWGGVLYIREGSKTVLTCHDNSTVKFTGNHATLGGVIHIAQSATILFSANSVVTFTRNTASSGGAVYASNGLQMLFNGNTKVTFLNNSATSTGGAITITNSNILFNAPVIFQDNTAQNGLAAVYCVGNSSLRFVEKLYKALAKSNAKDGEYLISSDCNVSIGEYKYKDTCTGSIVCCAAKKVSTPHCEYLYLQKSKMQ